MKKRYYIVKRVSKKEFEKHYKEHQMPFPNLDLCFQMTEPLSEKELALYCSDIEEDRIEIDLAEWEVSMK